MTHKIFGNFGRLINTFSTIHYINVLIDKSNSENWECQVLRALTHFVFFVAAQRVRTGNSIRQRILVEILFVKNCESKQLQTDLSIYFLVDMVSVHNITQFGVVFLMTPIDQQDVLFKVWFVSNMKDSCLTKLHTPVQMKLDISPERKQDLNLTYG